MWRIAHSRASRHATNVRHATAVAGDMRTATTLSQHDKPVWREVKEKWARLVDNDRKRQIHASGGQTSPVLASTSHWRVDQIKIIASATPPTHVSLVPLEQGQVPRVYERQRDEIVDRSWILGTKGRWMSQAPPYQSAMLAKAANSAIALPYGDHMAAVKFTELPSSLELWETSDRVQLDVLRHEESSVVVAEQPAGLLASIARGFDGIVDQVGMSATDSVARNFVETVFGKSYLENYFGVGAQQALRRLAKDMSTIANGGSYDQQWSKLERLVSPSLRRDLTAQMATLRSALNPLQLSLNIKRMTPATVENVSVIWGPDVPIDHVTVDADDATYSEPTIISCGNDYDLLKWHSSEWILPRGQQTAADVKRSMNLGARFRVTVTQSVHFASPSPDSRVSVKPHRVPSGQGLSKALWAATAADAEVVKTAVQEEVRNVRMVFESSFVPASILEGREALAWGIGEEEDGWNGHWKVAVSEGLLMGPRSAEKAESSASVANGGALALPSGVHPEILESIVRAASR